MPRKKRTKPDAAAAGTGLTVPAAAASPPPAAVLQVKTWIVEGQQPADILEAVAENFPSENRDALLSVALAELGTEAERLDVDLCRGFLLNAYRELYRRALSISDFGSALAALRAFERVTVG